MTAASNSEARKRKWEKFEVELRFVDQHGKEFWTDDAGRILRYDPEALEQAFGNASEVIPPGQAASGSGVAKNPAGRHVLPGEGCE